MEIPPPTLLDIPIIVPGEFSRNVTMAQFPFSRRMPPDREAQMVRPAPKATPMPQHEYAKIRMKQALGRLSRQHQPGVWVGGMRLAFQEVAEVVEGRIERYPPHYLIALWEPLPTGKPFLTRWPAVAAIASPDSNRALLDLVGHLPAGAKVWLSDQELDWALVAEIVLRTDRNLETYHRRELAKLAEGMRRQDEATIARSYSDVNTDFETFKTRLFDVLEGS